MIISKFGKVEVEVEGCGFCGAFRKALLLDIPILTSVNPSLNAQWLDFSGGLSVAIAATNPAIEGWWTGAKRLD